MYRYIPLTCSPSPLPSTTYLSFFLQPRSHSLSLSLILHLFLSLLHSLSPSLPVSLTHSLVLRLARWGSLSLPRVSLLLTCCLPLPDSLSYRYVPLTRSSPPLFHSSLSLSLVVSLTHSLSPSPSLVVRLPHSLSLSFTHSSRSFRPHAMTLCVSLSPPLSLTLCLFSPLVLPMSLSHERSHRPTASHTCSRN